jgi:hypothetical protein
VCTSVSTVITILSEYFAFSRVNIVRNVEKEL